MCRKLSLVTESLKRQLFCVKLHIGELKGFPFSAGDRNFFAIYQCQNVVVKCDDMVEVHQVFTVAAEKDGSRKLLLPLEQAFFTVIGAGPCPQLTAAGLGGKIADIPD